MEHIAEVLMRTFVKETGFLDAVKAKGGVNLEAFSALFPYRKKPDSNFFSTYSSD